MDAGLLHVWLVGRSIARGLPAPVRDRGGWRVDTRSEDEERRWVFAAVGPGLVALGREIVTPRNPIKLCGPMTALLDALPDGWSAHAPAFVMRAGGGWGERALPPGYAAVVDRAGAVTSIRIVDGGGALAASGYAAETPDAFVYDRIVTEAGHRRRGLGNAVMSLLRAQRRDERVPELLTATEDGRALYESLGWEVLSDYSTASILGG